MNKKRVLALFVMLQVVFTSMFPAPAHAATYAPVVDRDWNSTAYCVSGVSNRFDAALGLIGQWGKKIQISNEMYVKLSNESTGGAFWTLADSMVNPVVGANRMATAPEGWGLGPISTVLWLKIVGTCWAEYGSPADWMWCTSVNQEMIDNANRDFLKVLNGESLGGGGGGGAVGEYLYFTCNVNLKTNSTCVLKTGDTYYTNSPSGVTATNATPATVMLPSTVAVRIPTSRITGGFDLNGSSAFLLAMGIVRVDGRCDFNLYQIPGGSPVTANYSGTDRNGKSYSYAATLGWSGQTGEGYYSVFRSNATYTFDGSLITVNVSSDLSGTYTRGTVASNQFSNAPLVGVVGGGGGGDNHWPEPTTPDPDPPTTNPEPDPDPPDPPTFDPPGFDPDIPVPDVPVTIVPPDNTTAADYTPWLRAILTALNTIIDDLGEHCDHIRVAMRDYFSGFYDALSEDLQAYYDDLTDYLSDLAKWIVSHLNFDIKQPDVNVNVPGYDDSSVIGWLRRIYYKLRGTGSPRPDPIEDTDGALDWWAKFLEWITNALGGLLTDFVGDLGEFLQELIDTFPFSIPWDIVAMLTLLDAQRATPDFTVTIPAQEGWWDDITVRIELSAYNDAMATVRGMMLIWWMFILVMKTDWMMLLFDGANDAIADFVSRLTGKG